MGTTDGRKVSTDALETLGTIIDDKQKRDAIHIAVLPVIAGEWFNPGDDIGVGSDGLAFSVLKHTGIVDPFLKEPVEKGQRFWMLLYPRMVTSLRHVWSHPAFTDDDGHTPLPPASSASKDFIRDLAATGGRTFDELVAAGHAFLDDGEYFNGAEGGEWEGVSVPTDFWPHFENVTGRKVPDGKRENFFSCAC